MHGPEGVWEAGGVRRAPLRQRFGMKESRYDKTVDIFAQRALKYHVYPRKCFIRVENINIQDGCIRRL